MSVTPAELVASEGNGSPRDVIWVCLPDGRNVEMARGAAVALARRPAPPQARVATPTAPAVVPLTLAEARAEHYAKVGVLSFSDARDLHYMTALASRSIGSGR
jgi:hypothetical protein